MSLHRSFSETGVGGPVTLSFPMVSSQCEARVKAVCQHKPQPSGQSRTVGSSWEDCCSSEARIWRLNADKDIILGNQTLSPNLALLAQCTWPNIWTEFWQNIKELMEQRKSLNIMNRENCHSSPHSHWRYPMNSSSAGKSSEGVSSCQRG